MRKKKKGKYYIKFNGVHGKKKKELDKNDEMHDHLCTTCVWSVLLVFIIVIHILTSQGVVMNKAELIECMAEDTKLSKTACKSAVESFINSIEKTMKNGDSVVLTGFGTFSVVSRKKRTGINPATGKKMEIPARKVPKFKPGKKLKDVVS